MKRLLFFAFAVVLTSVVITQHSRLFNSDQNSSIRSINTIKSSNDKELSLLDNLIIKPSKANQFAWQAQVPTGEIENRKPISWWWWVIGVALAIGAGMLLYVWMKKDPKKDA